MKATLSSQVAVIIGILSFLITTTAISQVSISNDGSQPDNSAILDVRSTTKGLLIPRMEQGQISQIADPANGMLVFCTTNNKFYAYLSGGNSWKELEFGTGSIAPWTCGEPFTDYRDGKAYNTVLIGTQCWMAQDLNVGVKIAGNTDQSDNGIIEKYCYMDDENNCSVYGGLYQWDEMMQYVTTEGAGGICMAGWHVPADGEMSVLSDYLGGDAVAGAKMKETGYTHWLFPNQGATNESGFTGLGSGRRYINGAYQYLTWYLYLRSSTSYDDTHAWTRSVTYYYISMDRHNAYEKSNGFSVRCVKD